MLLNIPHRPNTNTTRQKLCYYLIISRLEEREKKKRFLLKEWSLQCSRMNEGLRSAPALIRDFRLYWHSRNNSESLPVQQLSSLPLSQRTLREHRASIRNSLWLAQSAQRAIFYTICIFSQPTITRPPALVTKTKEQLFSSILQDVQSLLPEAAWLSFIFEKKWFNTWSLIVESSHLDGVRRVGQQRVFDPTRVIVFG